MTNTPRQPVRVAVDGFCRRPADCIRSTTLTVPSLPIVTLVAVAGIVMLG